MGAVLGLRLAIKCKELLGLTTLMFWTDSMDVVFWIRGQSRRYKPFISHRIAEIQEETCPQQWRHVPGKKNPADLATRGASVHDLIHDSFWTYGPDFLQLEEKNWPTPKNIDQPEFSEQAQDEIPKNKVQTFATCHGENTLVNESIIDCHRYSSMSRLVRVTAWVLRFVHVLKTRQKPSYPVLELRELDRAEQYWIRQVQQETLSPVIKSLRSDKPCTSGNLKPLLPFLDDEGFVRVGGRLQNSDLPFHVRHPYLVPRQSHVAQLLVRRVHCNGRHARGVNASLADLRQKYWVVHGREELKKYARGCVVCNMKRKRPYKQVMAPLPSHRITVRIRAFAKTGVDYAGPYLVKISRKTNAKRWLCLFTCTTSRAVHLEIAYGLDTDSFLLAFSRMVARRGKPELVISDNGTNFVGANRELGEAKLTDEELVTVVAEVEGILNSRPLTYCSDDPNDDVVLTPNHFLIGQAGGQLAPRVLEDIAASPRDRWRYIQQMVTQIWRRWNREFLSLLQTRGKWLDIKQDPEVGDIVLVADWTNPKGKWPLGRIVETLPCKDGHARSVRVESRGKEFLRPISKICPLYVNNADSVANGLALDHGGERVGAQDPAAETDQPVAADGEKVT
ncbi:uncharacterized protein LOC135499401 [Lineus longissimus]|uniref:uncharacterized protein LOC135499401 n=1 Tax=Lineus longissimus TaxID=88925 RepID=UPI00315CED5A